MPWTRTPRSSSRRAGAICNAVAAEHGSFPGMVFAIVTSVATNSLGASLRDGHLVQYYEQEDFLYDRIADFMSDGLRGSDAAVLIATRVHREGVESRFRGNGVDLPHLRAIGRYHPLDAEETLSRFMVNG